MITVYESTFFGDHINYNDQRIKDVADNLYEKVRQRGILPDYVMRDKLRREMFDIVDVSVEPPVSIKDDRFTFGYAYKGAKLDIIADLLNIGKVWDFEFEFSYDEEDAANNLAFMDGYITVSGSFVTTVGDITFPNTVAEFGKVNKFKISRVRNTVKLFINHVESPHQLLSLDTDTQFKTLYESI